jgi:hypothetical protein
LVTKPFDCIGNANFRGIVEIVYSALRALFIRDAALSLVYLFMKIDDLLMRPWRG